MAQVHTPESHIDATQLVDEELDVEFESVGDQHRLAAHHFAAAAKHHLAAAAANDEDDVDANARHAFLAYRHQLNGAQYAEIAVMDNESLEDEFDAEATEN